MRTLDALVEMYDKDTELLTAARAAHANGDHEKGRQIYKERHRFFCDIESQSEEGFRFMYMTYRSRRRRKNVYFDLSEREAKSEEEVIAIFRRYGVRRFVLGRDGYNDILDAAMKFQKCGCEILRVIEEYGDLYQPLSDDYAKSLGILFEIQ